MKFGHPKKINHFEFLFSVGLPKSDNGGDGNLDLHITPVGQGFLKLRGPRLVKAQKRKEKRKAQLIKD